ncbi:MAG: hypothetical protein NTV77_00560 [Candidatus Azambacteria bacterium]|nr:hypothetical protein [Candidatus Azambacteria bacterium]
MRGARAIKGVFRALKDRPNIRTDRFGKKASCMAVHPQYSVYHHYVRAAPAGIAEKSSRS